MLNYILKSLNKNKCVYLIYTLKDAFPKIKRLENFSKLVGLLPFVEVHMPKKHEDLLPTKSIRKILSKFDIFK